jgi:hypothetical protein
MVPCCVGAPLAAGMPPIVSQGIQQSKKDENDRKTTIFPRAEVG